MRVCTAFCVGLALVAGALSGLVPSALAAESSGSAIAVQQATSAAGPGGQRVLQISGPIFSGDRITTSAQGQAQIQFVDETKLVVGPNSSLLIDQFVFGPDKTAGKVSINAVKGAFRFITGVSAKQAYSIKTPTATIGVRGTRFDFSVINGITNFALFEGGARICDNRFRCVDLRGRCEVAVIPAHNDMQRLAHGTATAHFLAANLPYVRSQTSLLTQFRVDTSGCASTGGELLGPDPAFRGNFAPPPSGGPPSPGDGSHDGGEG